MKRRLFSFLMIALFVGVAGFLFSACELSQYYVNVKLDTQSEEVAEIIIKSNEKTFYGSDGLYKIDANTNLTVELHALKSGIDFSNAIITVDGKRKTIIKNPNYNLSANQRAASETCYGHINIASLNKDTEIKLSGVKELEYKFQLQVENENDETAQKYMKMCYVDFNMNGEFENLYELLQDETKREFSRGYGYGNFSMFNMKFVDDEGNGCEIFDFSINRGFSIAKNGKTTPVQAVYSSNDTYTVYIGDLTSYTNVLVVDFKELVPKKFVFQKTPKNALYDLSDLPETITYFESGSFFLIKNTTLNWIDSSNIVVKLFNTELQLAEGYNLSDQVLEYIIPVGLTPYKTSNYNYSEYRIVVEGLEFDKEMYTSILEIDENVYTDFSFNYLDGDRNVVGEALRDVDGNYILPKETTIALTWQYQYDNDRKQYFSAYDMYDFDIEISTTSPNPNYVPPEPSEPKPKDENEELEEELEKEEQEPEFLTNVETVNIKEVMTTNNAFAQVGDVEIDLGNGFVLKALFNQNTQTFDKFQFEYSIATDCKIDVHIGNYARYEEVVKVQTEITDSRIEDISYKIVDDPKDNSVDWDELGKNNWAVKAAKSSQYIVFRIKATTYYNQFAFILENDKVCASRNVSAISTSSENEFCYTEIAFQVGEGQFTRNEIVKLVETMSIGN